MQEKRGVKQTKFNYYCRFGATEKDTDRHSTGFEINRTPYGYEGKAVRQIGRGEMLQNLGNKRFNLHFNRKKKWTKKMMSKGFITP
ncbi:hypothetical protein CUN85_05110 [Methanolobus halotolerans]|uniref:Uncharacterized protein n=1 Tax=Methanolobus halotolerans TaxID=2052935 RepID=A0A4E0Q099_9EURY|nr:hypothetical protein CUN85_05110 [Methanolobus halotolerans]